MAVINPMSSKRKGALKWKSFSIQRSGPLALPGPNSGACGLTCMWTCECLAVPGHILDAP